MQTIRSQVSFDTRTNKGTIVGWGNWPTPPPTPPAPPVAPTKQCPTVARDCAHMYDDVGSSKGPTWADCCDQCASTKVSVSSFAFHIHIVCQNCCDQCTVIAWIDCCDQCASTKLNYACFILVIFITWVDLIVVINVHEGKVSLSCFGLFIFHIFTFSVMMSIFIVILNNSSSSNSQWQ